MNNLSQFTNLYPVSKTLRFELKPIGKTLENIEKDGIISEDEKRAENYKKVKIIIDKYHKWFIEKSLSCVKLPEEKLNIYYNLYKATPDVKKEEKWNKEFEDIKKELRKEITNSFSSDEVKDLYKDLGKKELIRDILPEWKELDEEEKQLFGDFYQFTTYFVGFNENRKNMYSSEEKSTAISYRIINDNLPKFIDNIETFKIIKKTEFYSLFNNIYSELEPWLNISSIDEIFELTYLNEVLSQSQIEEYNFIIGGRSGEDRNDKIRGLNQYINEYNQKHEKKDRLPKFKMLYKQILSDREKISFLPESFENVNDLFVSVETYYKSNLLCVKNENNEEINIFDELSKLMSEISSYDLSKIYIKNDKNITDISQKLFGNYGVITSSINYYYESFINPNYKDDYARAKTESKRDRIEKDKEKYTKQKYLSLLEIQEAIKKYLEYTNEYSDSVVSYDKCLINYFSKIFDEKDKTNKIKDVYDKYTLLEPVLNVSYPETKKLSKNEKKLLKDFLDAILEIEHLVKPIYITSDEYSENDLTFYSQFNELYSHLDLLISLYNKVRSFVTKKPYSTEKIKLNFNSPTLLDGWDVNKETSNLSIILKKENKYFLGIINKRDTKAIEKLKETQNDDFYEKMEYKLLPGPNKMLPKVFFSKSRIDEFKPSAEILRIKKEETFKKGNNFSINDCYALIDFYKTSINNHPEWKEFEFNFSDTKDYVDISGFFNEVSLQGYKLSFKKLSVKDINDLVDTGKLYLFQIYNKDFSDSSKGRKNLHTMYWNALFEEKNLKDIVYKLNGQAEIFYRKASIPQESIVRHQKGDEMEFKNPLRNGNGERFKYEIVKDRRYTVDKFQFHVPITMNFKSSGDFKINSKVREYIRNNPDVNILGVDRGERNLIYISLIDQKGNVIFDEDGKPIQYSLNTIESKYKKGDETVTFKTPYHTLLDEREKSRKQARQQWDDIEGIKELKDGYISQVVSLVTRLMVKYNAILVMEDLNFGFKKGRIRVEKQVYQKFEKMLIDKLNYLVFKDSKPGEVGELYNALQLTNKFTSFSSLGKQTGFIFYVPAWDTSKIDPVTGFVNLFPRYNTVKERQEFFNKFDFIKFYGENFVFSFDYDNFTSRASETKTKWTIFTQGGERYFWNNRADNGKGATEKINVTEAMKKSLSEAGIQLEKDMDLKEKISSLDGKYIGEIYRLFNIVLAMRYSKDEEDFILSPVADENGKFFDSRTAANNLPKDADANGAYNIARKGLWYIMQLNDASGDLMKTNLAITNKEWLSFAQNKPYLDN